MPNIRANYFNYVNVAASQTTAQICGEGGFLHNITIVPLSTAAGAVSILDGSTTIVSVPSFANIPAPFTLTLDIFSGASGGFKVTTGASVSVIVSGFNPSEV